MLHIEHHSHHHHQRHLSDEQHHEEAHPVLKGVASIVLFIFVVLMLIQGFSKLRYMRYNYNKTVRQNMDKLYNHGRE